MSDQNFDMIVIGAGPGGDVAAIGGVQLGLKVAYAEREHSGGICLKRGCIQTLSEMMLESVFDAYDRVIHV